MAKVGESSLGNVAMSQLEQDEALALALQQLELEDEEAGMPLFERATTDSNRDGSRSEPIVETASAVAGEHNSVNANTQVRQDGIDPDNMSYEELQSLGESIGSESRGLSDELISYLKPFKYKTGFFLKREKNECVICCMKYKNRDMLISLPCQHRYHSECVTKWLKINKACPVCNNEVFGS